MKDREINKKLIITSTPKGISKFYEMYKKTKYRLLLEDQEDRSLKMIAKYMSNTIYLWGNWEIVKNYDQFVDYIEKNGLPDLISFDHDLSDKHYGQLKNINYDEIGEKTGYHAAKWLTEYCQKNNLKFPNYLVHSWNREGAKNIISWIENYKKHCEDNLINITKP